MPLRSLYTKITINRQVAQEPDLCEYFTGERGQEDLDTLGSWVLQGYERDKLSRMKWERRTSAAMDLAMQIQKEKTFPWPNCANVTFPLVTIASLQFSCRSYPNLISGSEVFKYRTLGKDPDQRMRERADRIGKHLSWHVLEEDVGWEEQHDRLLINLGIVGCNFIKTYYSPKHRYSVSELVMARDFVLDYYAKSVEECARKTQVLSMYRNDLYEKMVSGVYRNQLEETWFNSPAPREVEVQTDEADNRRGLYNTGDLDDDSPYQILEQHRNLDKDGYAEPYIVTIEKSSAKVIKLSARWEREEDVDKSDFPGMQGRIKKIRSTEYFTKYGFIPSPDGGVYDVGFGTLLGPINESVNSGINQILDNGTMMNSNGGFLARGVKIRGGVYTMAPWEWKRVDSSGADLKNSMVPFPVRESGTVMFQLLGLLIEYADRLAGATDPMVGVNPGQNTPAETSRNMTEQGMQVYKGIFKRVWRSMKEEAKKLHKLQALYLPASKTFGNADAYITQEDYRTNPDLIVPCADPNIVSDGMRLTQAQALRQSAHEVNGYSQENVERNWLRALKVDEIDHFYPGPDKVPPLPNAKMQVEQGKMAIAKMKIDFEKAKFVAELRATASKTQAEVVKLYAEVTQLLAQTEDTKTQTKIAAFSTIVESLETAHNMMMSRAEALEKTSESGEGKDGEGGAVGGMAGASGQPGVLPQVSGQGPGQPPGAMG
jgi:chaperonin GroES